MDWNKLKAFYEVALDEKLKPIFIQFQLLTNQYESTQNYYCST